MTHRDPSSDALITVDDIRSNAEGEPAWYTKLSAAYEKVFPLRAAVQAIPVVGGALDTMFAGLGARWQAERMEGFFQELSARLHRLEMDRAIPALAPSP